MVTWDTAGEDRGTMYANCGNTKFRKGFQRLALTHSQITNQALSYLFSTQPINFQVATADHP